MTTMKGSVLRSAPLALLRGVLFAAVLSIALILLFALLVLLFDWGTGVVSSGNQIVKVLSILFGTLVAAKGNALRGWAAGLAVGGAYMALGIALYCAFSGELLPLAVMAGDLGLGLAAGFLSGLLAASLKK
ncbi:MAG: TIGR04086 family membrane protein [Candidatus Spyradocola sp.]|jgi:putative membrane protein (TIGR04086 family)